MSLDFGASADYPTRHEMGRATAWTKKALVQDVNLKYWYGPEYDAALQAIRAFNKSAQSTATKGKALRQQAANNLLPALEAFQDAMAARPPRKVETGYLPRLRQQVLNAFGTDTTDWLAFDRDLRYLAATVLAAGGDGETVVRGLAEEQLRAADLTAGLTAWLRVFTPGTADFEVAFYLRGVKAFVRALPAGVAAAAEPCRWPSKATAAEHNELEQFRQRQKRSGQVGLVIVVAVTAPDAGAAQRLALSAVEVLHDQLLALHRASLFTIDPHALIRSGASIVREQRSSSPAVARGRTLDPQAAADLRSALRYFALARTEPTPLMAITDAFIALEQLSQDAVRPSQAKIQKSAFLPPHISACAQLATVRHLLANSHTLAFEGAKRSPRKERFLELNAWLGSSGDPYRVDLDRWSTVLGAAPAATASTPISSAADAAALLDEVLAACGPFVRERLAMARRLWSNPQELVRFASAEGRRAFAHVDRLRRLRNLTVHTAPISATGDAQLAQTAIDLLDATFEVAPLWIPPEPPWHALRQALLHRRVLWRDLGAGRLPPADKILHP
jgi:hypothetical protein